jgi:hypothetical protein
MGEAIHDKNGCNPLCGSQDGLSRISSKSLIETGFSLDLHDYCDWVREKESYPYQHKTVDEMNFN